MTTSEWRDMILTALMQAELSLAVYGGKAAVDALAQRHGGSGFMIDAGSVSAGVLVFGDHVHLSVKGTDSVRDWARNFAISQESVGAFRGLRAHRGFRNDAQRLIRELVVSWIYPALCFRRLYVGGHSAGGAIATLLGAHEELRVSGVFTFGSPRVLDPESAAKYKALPWELRRFVMPGDPVPMMPFRKFRRWFGRAEYAHPVSPLLLDDLGVVRVQESLRVWDRARMIGKTGLAYLSSLASLAIGRDVPSWSLQAHDMTRYLAAIQNAADVEQFIYEGGST